MLSGAKWSLIAAIIFFVVVGAIVYMWVFGVAFFSATTAETRGQTEVREDTVAEGSFRIAAYEHFYDLCASVQADEGRIENLERELAETEDESRKTQLQASITAVRNSRSEKISEYNADARMEGTIAQFRASDLPGELQTDEETTCESDE